jgi:DNA (cytosine-5)-methyltransferase 1
MKKIKVGSDFSGVGAFNQALIRLNINYEELFACDMDRYARQTFIHNYGEPKYYPNDVYEREIPIDPLTIYMSSPPCQAFSSAGKRLGKYDKRGILFFNSHEFIQVNKPRFFIFENVKGLLSDDNGNTFNEWVNLLGGKSVNGNAVLFPHDESLPYHLYWKVLNAKNHGVPQNRERVFLVGIRDDNDNSFRFPVEEHLTKRLKDILEENVDEKYYLSENNIEKLIQYEIKQKQNGNGFTAKFHDVEGMMSALKVGGGGCDDLVKIKSDISKGSQVVNLDFCKYNFNTCSNFKYDLCNTCIDGDNYECFNGVVYNDKRLNETILKNKLPKGEPKAIDTYNQKVQDNAPTLKEPHHNTTRLWDGYKIRRLTPRECFRLMDFPDTFTWPVSDSQAYKQAGNSIVVRVLEKIIKNLNL